jgi:hypothetical protein
VRGWYDIADLLRPHHQCTWGICAPREYQVHSGLVDAQECDIIEEFLQVVQPLQAVRLGVFSSWSTADRSYQVWGFHMDREITGSL